MVRLGQRSGLALANWTEKWFPDALVFAFLGVVVTFVLGICIGEKPAQLAIAGGKGFWSLVPFTMQMVMIIIGGYVVATAPVINRLIEKLASLPKTPKSAVAFIAFFSMMTSLLSWGFSLIFSALLVKAIARRLKDLDYRAAGAAAYLGLGAIWALGLSSSAALMMATFESIPPKLFAISGLIPLVQTLFLWQNALMAVVLILLSLGVAYFSTPPSSEARNAEFYGVDLTEKPLHLSHSDRPREWLEYSPLLNLFMVALLGFYLIYEFKTSPKGALAALDLNTYNLISITLGLLLHWCPKNFGSAVLKAVPACGGVLIQFPFYAVTFGMIMGTGITGYVANLFVHISSPQTYPLLVALYSTVIGIFIPSGGSKWVMEAPYVLEAAKLHHMHLGWVVQIYNAAEALLNLVNPFWMLPLLAILKVKARDLVGYTFMQFIWHMPVVFFLCWMLSKTFHASP
ncbi:MAG: short-chain fatty acid transporter [Deltaproteobacteria bacterium]|nr:short-chain fatty acid transporter [Deltaproteobacteria bacterium]